MVALSVLLKPGGYYSQGPIETVCPFSRRFKLIRNENYSNNCLILISGIIPYFSYKLIRDWPKSIGGGGGGGVRSIWKCGR